VSGTLEPDATGTYEQRAPHNGYPSWQRQDNAWWLWTAASGLAYFLTPQLGIEPDPPTAYWVSDQDPGTYPWVLEPQQGAVGIATATFP